MVYAEPKVAPGDMYSIKDTCKLLGISRSTLTRYIKDGRIKAKTHKGTSRTLITGFEIVRFWKQTY